MPYASCGNRTPEDQKSSMNRMTVRHRPGPSAGACAFFHRIAGQIGDLGCSRHTRRHFFNLTLDVASITRLVGLDQEGQNAPLLLSECTPHPSRTTLSESESESAGMRRPVNLDERVRPALKFPSLIDGHCPPDHKMGCRGGPAERRGSPSSSRAMARVPAIFLCFHIP